MQLQKSFVFVKKIIIITDVEKLIVQRNGFEYLDENCKDLLETCRNMTL